MIETITVIAVVGTYSSPFIKLCLDELVCFIRRYIGRKDNDWEELKKLERTLMKIQDIIDDVESKQINVKSWQPWLRDLKAAVYEAEDTLDHLNQVRHHSSKITIPDNLGEVQEKLDNIAKEIEGLHKRRLVRGTHVIRERPQTSSFLDHSSVLGREDDKEELVKSLLSNESNAKNVSIISLVGMWGLGKTTLAQIVYNDERVETYFNLRIWVSATGDFDVIKLTKSIIESVANNGKKKQATQSDLMGLDPLQVTLERLLRDERFLLVLDGLWNVSYKDWDEFIAPLGVGASGSKILVTTQSQTVSLIIGSKPIPLKSLSDETCMLVLQRRAFPNGIVNVHGNLVAIGEKIAKKCGGLPLLAKTLGSLLNSISDEHEWEAVLKSEIWDLLEDNNDIWPALWLSYQCLPPHLKQCFAYCSTFPKGHKFEKNTLVQLWMAQGFIQPKGTRRMEDIGSNYFNNLLSFFQTQEAELNNQPSYQMHNLFHDLAQNVFREECLRMEDGNNKYKPFIFSKFRHLLWVCSNNSAVTIKDIKNWECGSLRTIRQQCKHQEHQIHEGLSKILTKVKHLRVLDLRGARITSLPDDIGSLKLLRYLDLSETLIEKLPKTVCKLYCLQTLKLEECKNLHELGNINFEELTDLRHLYLDRNSWLKSMPNKIEKLTSLQTLWPFFVSREGRKTGELKDMNDLRALCISGLQNAANVLEAELQNKRYLRRLMLQWGGTPAVANAAVQVNLLRDLRPHPNLKELYIKNYVGQSFPDWMVNSSSYLVKVSLCNCKILPSLWRLPFLKSLNIAEMNCVTCVSDDFYGNDSVKGFPSLETLEFCQMEELSRWDRVGKYDLHCLRQLTIKDCPKLDTIPVLQQLHSIQFLKIGNNSSLNQWMRDRHPNWKKQTQTDLMVIYNRKSSTTVQHVPWTWLY